MKRKKMSKRTLFNIAEEYTLAIEELEESINDDSLGSEIPEHILERIEINKDEMGKKIRDYKYITDQLTEEIQLLGEEIARIKRTIQKKETLKEILKEKVTYALELYGDVTKTKGRKFKTDLVNVSLIRRPKVEVIDEEEIPDEYRAADISLKNLDIKTMSKVLLALQDQFNIDSSEQVKKKIKILASKIEGDLKAKQSVPGAKLDEDNCYIRFY
jgi:ribosomal protein S13